MSTTRTTADWLQRHNAALLNPVTAGEWSIVTLVNEMDRLTERYKDDYVMVESVAHVARAIRVLLIGEIGRLDPGTIDRRIERMAELTGLNVDDL